MTEPSPDAPLTEQAEYWVVRLASGEIEAGELVQFKAWHATSSDHRAAFDRERFLWQNLDAAEAVIRAPSPPSSLRWIHAITPMRMLAATAAAIALIVVTPKAMVHWQADAITTAGEIRRVALPDGSLAMLDSDSAISLRFDAGERQVTLLRGRAWFDVKHGDRRPFRVAALDGMTQDVGTAFEVARESDAVTVGVTQGAVSVAAPGGSHGIGLTASERAQYRDGGPVERLGPTLASSIAPWRRGLVVIDGKDIEEAAAQIARYRRGYTFVFPGRISQRRLSGVFRTDAPDEALRTLAQMAELDVISLPGGITILR